MNKTISTLTKVMLLSLGLSEVTHVAHSMPSGDPFIRHLFESFFNDPFFNGQSDPFNDFDIFDGFFGNRNNLKKSYSKSYSIGSYQKNGQQFVVVQEGNNPPKLFKVSASGELVEATEGEEQKPKTHNLPTNQPEQNSWIKQNQMKPASPIQLGGFFPGMDMGFPMQSGLGNQGAQESKSSFLKRFDPKSGDKKVTFDDIIGQEEAIKDLKMIVELQKNPERRKKLGINLPTGILFSGPPGTGKTLCAQAAAQQLGLPFFYMVASDVMDKYVGESQKRLEAAFEEVRAAAPAILFIDEIDALAGKRGGETHESHLQALNKLLALLDGFQKDDKLIVITATNHPELLDRAFLRSGRMDKKIMFLPPDKKNIEKLLSHYLSQKPHSKNIDTKYIEQLANKCSAGTPGESLGSRRAFTGADAAQMLNDAAMNAFANSREVITIEDLDKAADRITVGQDRHEEAKIQEDEYTAYHEAGHAIVALRLGLPINEITIVSRGNAGGLTRLDENKNVITKKHHKKRIAMLYGGFLAEKMFFGEDGVTSGAIADMNQANAEARHMIRECGMGNRTEGLIFNNEMSEEMRQKFDADEHTLIAEEKELAKKILTAHESDVKILANALLQKKTLDKKAIYQLVGSSFRGK